MGYSLGLLSGPHDPSTQRVPVAPLPSPRTPTRRSRRSNDRGYAYEARAIGVAALRGSLGCSIHLSSRTDLYDDWKQLQCVAIGFGLDLRDSNRISPSCWLARRTPRSCSG